MTAPNVRGPKCQSKHRPGRIRERLLILHTDPEGKPKYRAWKRASRSDELSIAALPAAWASWVLGFILLGLLAEALQQKNNNANASNLQT